jgi:hypothetical protein
MRKVQFMMKGLAAIRFSVVILLLLQGAAAAGGPFGPPQPLSKEKGGWATALGYWRNEAKFENGKEQVVSQNQVYSQLGYGQKYWEICGRIGLSDLKIADAFRSTQASLVTTKNDFEDSWEWFGTLGAKGFYPLNKTFGMGVFLQGSYYFNDFTDKVSGSNNGAPFETQFKVSNFWDVNFGLAFQVTIPANIKLYIGPYAYYSEAKGSPSTNVTGLALASGETTIKNKTSLGGFTGIEVPLAKGFRLNLEGQYTERLSVGAAVLYVY